MKNRVWIPEKLCLANSNNNIRRSVRYRCSLYVSIVNIINIVYTKVINSVLVSLSPPEPSPTTLTNHCFCQILGDAQYNLPL